MSETATDSSSDDEAAPRGGLTPWLRLMRLPTVFTALTNILCGYFVSTDSRALPDVFGQTEFWLLLVSSALLYLGGMVLNDVFDYELDCQERPERPLPSGQIPLRSAATLGWLMMVGGLGSAFAAGLVSETGYSSFLIAVVLAALVWFYDSTLKSTPFSPFGMAGCRFLNIMLGASCCGDWETVWGGPQVMIAGAMFVYILGVTWFARNETGTASLWQLIVSVLMVLSAIGLNAWLCHRTDPGNRSPAMGAMLALALVAANIVRASIRAISSGESIRLQKHVGFMLLNIIFIDAAMTFCVTGSSSFAFLAVAPLVPAILLKKIIPLS